MKRWGLGLSILPVACGALFVFVGGEEPVPADAKKPASKVVAPAPTLPAVKLQVWAGGGKTERVNPVTRFSWVDGRLLKVLGTDGRTVTVTPSKSGDYFMDLASLSKPGSAYCATAQLVAEPDANEQVVRIRDVRSRKELTTLRAPMAGPHSPSSPKKEAFLGFIRQLTFSPDGSLLAGWSVETSPARLGKISIWDVKSGQRVYSYPMDQTMVSDLTFSPDGRRLAAAVGNGYATKYDGSQDGAVLVFDVTGKSLIYRKRLSRWNLQTVEYSPDGQYLGVPIPMTREVHILDASTGNIVKSLELRPVKGTGNDYPPAIERMKFSPDGKILAGSGNSGTRLWRVRDGRIIGDVEKPFSTYISKWTTELEFSRDGRYLAMGTEGGYLFVAGVR